MRHRLLSTLLVAAALAGCEGNARLADDGPRFPEPDRPVSELGSNQFSTEDQRDSRGEASTVMELAEKRGYKVVNRSIMPEEIANSEEIFVTGTAAEVTPVSQIDNLTFKVGVVGQQMMEDYDALVNRREPRLIELPSEAAAE